MTRKRKNIILGDTIAMACLFVVQQIWKTTRTQWDWNDKLDKEPPRAEIGSCRVHVCFMSDWWGNVPSPTAWLLLSSFTRPKGKTKAMSAWLVRCWLGSKSLLHNREGCPGVRFGRRGKDVNHVFVAGIPLFQKNIMDAELICKEFDTIDKLIVSGIKHDGNKIILPCVYKGGDSDYFAISKSMKSSIN